MAAVAAAFGPLPLRRDFLRQNARSGASSVAAFSSSQPPPHASQRVGVNREERLEAEPRGRVDQTVEHDIVELLRRGRSRPSMETQAALTRLVSGRYSVDHKVVYNVMRKVEDPDAALLFFYWCAQHMYHQTACYNSLFAALVKYGRHRQAYRIFQEEMLPTREPNVHTYTQLLRGFCLSGEMEEACRLLDDMRARNIEGSVRLYTVIVQGFCRAKRSILGLRFLREVQEKSNVVPDKVCYNSLLYSLADAGETDAAYELLQEISSKEQRVERYTYTKALDAFCKQKQFDRAMEALHWMKSAGCDMDTVTYNILLNGMLACGKMDEAMSLFEDIVKGGAACSRTYNILIRGLCKEGRTDMALELFHNMKARDFVTYSIMISSLCKADRIEDALRLLKPMKEEGCCSGVSYTALMDHLFKLERGEEALQLYREMVDNCSSISLISYNILMRGLCSLGRVHQAAEVIQEMKQKGIEPDAFSYGTIRDSFLKAELPAEALKVMLDMRTEGIRIDDRSYYKVTFALMKQERLDESIELFRQMIAFGESLPSLYICNTILHGLTKAGRIDDAVRFLEEMKASKIQLDNLSYGTIVRAMLRIGKVQEACELSKVWLDEGVELDGSLCNTLIDVLCKDGKVDEAQVLLEGMAARGVEFDQVTFSSMIDGYLMVKNVKGALKVVEKMQDGGRSPAEGTFIRIVRTICDDVEQIDEALEAFEQSKFKGEYKKQAYSTLVDGLCKADRLNKAVDYFQEMIDLGMLPDRSTYNVMLDCAKRNKNIELQDVIFSQMTGLGY